MTSKTKKLRVSVLARLMMFYTTQGFGIYHGYWHLVNNPEYKHCWTEKERELMLKQLESFNRTLTFMSKMGNRLRHGR